MPETVWVVPLAKVRACDVVTVFVRLKNVVLPEMLCPEPLRFTVPLDVLKVPPERAQSPATERVPDVEVNVPPLSVKVPLTVIALDPPAKVPPACVHPELPTVIV